MAYNVFRTVNVLDLANVQLGSLPILNALLPSSGIEVSTADGVLGNQPQDSFTANDGLLNASTPYIYQGVVQDEQGNVVGFVGANTGILGNTVYNVYVPDNVPNPGTLRISLLSANAADPSTQWDVEAQAPVCFLEGTMIATPSGEVKVEDLRAGDLVLTHDGRAVPVRWMGRSTHSRAFAHQDTLPIRILAGALGENLPSRDLLVSPTHAVFADGMLIQASALLNGTTVTRATNVAETFVYHHIELADHSLVLAEGLASETFVESANRMRFDNWAEYEELFGSEPAAPEMDLPRAKSARQVPAALRQRLMDRAAILLRTAVAA